MHVLIENTLREKLRNKTFYIVAFAGMILMLLITANNSHLSINGQKVTSFEQMIPVAMSIEIFLSSLLSVLISLPTIPNEFERKTTHLILVRGIKPGQYMFGMTMGNIVSSVFSMFLLTVSLYLFCLYHGKAAMLPAVLLSTLVLCVIPVFLSAVVSLLSIRLPSFVSAIAGILLYVCGILHGILYVFASTAEGAIAGLVKVLLFFTPDFSEVQTQASSVLTGGSVDLQPVAASLLLAYMVLSLTFVVFRKEV